MCANYLPQKTFNIATTCACDNTSFKFTSYTDAMNILKNYHKCKGKKHLSKNKNHIHIYHQNPMNFGITSVCDKNSSKITSYNNNINILKEYDNFQKNIYATITP